jgi:hypothetical protein
MRTCNRRRCSSTCKLPEASDAAACGLSVTRLSSKSPATSPPSMRCERGVAALWNVPEERARGGPRSVAAVVMG